KARAAAAEAERARLREEEAKAKAKAAAENPAEVKKDDEGENGNTTVTEEGPVSLQETKPKRTLPPLQVFPASPELESQFAIMLHEVMQQTLAAEGFEAASFGYEGKRFKAVGADTQGLRLKRGDNEELLPWEQVSPSLLAAVLKSIKLSEGPPQIALAVIACNAKDFEIAGQALATLIKTSPELRSEAEIYFAFKQDRDLPAEGLLVFKNALMFPADKANYERLERIKDALDELKKNLKSTTATMEKKREPLLDELLGLGEEARKPTVDILIEAREDAIKRAEKTTGAAKDTKALDELKRELIKRRKHALELIFDEQKWPYPYGPNNGEVTAEVLKRVEAVREIWENPASYKGKSSRKAEDWFELIRLIGEYLPKFDPAGEWHDNEMEKDLEYLNSISNKSLNIQNHAIDGQEKTFIINAKKITDWNDETEAKFKGDAKAPDAEAWEQLRITNDYRVMMGRLPMKMNFKLFWAAKHHSQWCVQSNGGQITHDSPGGPRGNNVPERCAHEGYTSGTGENIHMNGAGPSALSSHLAWLTSSGHHRNILNDRWTVMGNGKFGTIWTQNFGNAAEDKQNTESRGGS
ncbi:MAG: CAP domain-containing protein, partial [Planctomycetes bacterium]|nr:CAP domain-containing protein [Planctomycetota bacterium]